MIEYYYQSYDALGNVINHTLPDGNQLGCLYYGSGHLSQLNFKTPTAKYDIAEYERGDVCRANQLRQYNGYHYDYDGFGRLIKRQRPAENITQWFSYNHEHQLIEARVESLQHRSITRYQYAPNTLSWINPWG